MPSEFPDSVKWRRARRRDAFTLISGAVLFLALLCIVAWRLTERIATLENQLGALSGEVKSVRSALLTKAGALSDEVKSVRSELTGALNDEVKSVRSELTGALSDEVKSVRSELLTKASLNKPYRIRSEKGPVYVAVNNQAVYGGGISLGDAKNNPHELGLWWSLVEEW